MPLGLPQGFGLETSQRGEAVFPKTRNHHRPILLISHTEPTHRAVLGVSMKNVLRFETGRQMRSICRQFLFIWTTPSNFLQEHSVGEGGEGGAVGLQAPGRGFKFENFPGVLAVLAGRCVDVSFSH